MEDSPVPENSKKKIYLIGGITLLVLACGAYFLSSGSGLKGQLTNDLAPTPYSSPESSPESSTDVAPKPYTAPESTPSPIVDIAPAPYTSPEPEVPFNLEHFKITEIKYDQTNAYQEKVIKIHYTQVENNGDLFYTGNQGFFKTYITLCQKDECYDVKEYNSSGFSLIGGILELKYDEVVAFMQEHEFKNIDKLALSVSNGLEGAERYYAGN